MIGDSVGDEEDQAEEQAKEFRALIGLVGRLSGLTQLPAIQADTPSTPLPEIDQAVEDLTTAKHVSAPVRLEVLARLVRAQGQQELALPDPTELAASLAPPDTDAEVRNSTALRILDRLKGSQEGKDPLGREITDLHHPDALVSTLHPDLQSTIMMVLPRCRAVATTAGASGIRALNIVTEIHTAMELDDFYGIVNPRLWTSCWLERPFFTDMQVLPPGANPVKTLAPDEGWQATLLEVVDFSFGIGPKQEASTELEFVYFFNPTVPGGGLGCAGSTYDFKHSRDGKITVDQGYLLVEDVGPPTNARRYRTQKMVHLTAGDPPSDEVCAFWSLAVGLIQQGCSMQI